MASALGSSPVAATIPVADLDRARRFYSEKLGLAPVENDPEGVLFQCGGGTVLALFPTRGHAGGDHTEAGFMVDDLSSVMDDLRGRGVTFEDYDMPDLKTEGGVATLSVATGAWFKDSEGNIIALTQLNQPLP